MAVSVFISKRIGGCALRGPPTVDRPTFCFAEIFRIEAEVIHGKDAPDPSGLNGPQENVSTQLFLTLSAKSSPRRWFPGLDVTNQGSSTSEREGSHHRGRTKPPNGRAASP